MQEKKYNKILTIVLVIVAILILVIFGFWFYDIYKRYYVKKEANEATEEFGYAVNQNQGFSTSNFVGNVSLEINDIVTNSTVSDSRLAKVTYKGFTVVGRIEIPKIKLNYPVLDQATKASMEVSVGVVYGPGLNKVGNTVIMGHNYRNGTFFSDLKNLSNGDIVYITDLSGKKVKYTIYNIYQTTDSDFDYATRETNGKKEISLSTCTDDVKARLILWAREAE